MPRKPKPDWYDEGVRFTCTQCGNCCTGPTGYVWFTPEEGRAMAKHLRLTEQGFLAQYARKLKGRWSLNEVRADRGFDCVFLRRDESGKALCSIYPVRPAQCRTWPFWPFNLKSLRTYINVAKETPCPGMIAGLEGRGDLIPVEQVRIRRDATPE